MTSYFPFLRTHKYRQRWGNPHLKHWSWDKKAEILQKTFTKIFSSMKFYQNFTEFVQGPINITSTLVWVMAWCQTSNKPLPEPMMTQFNEEYKSHWVKLKVKYCHETSVRFQYKDHFFNNSRIIRKLIDTTILYLLSSITFWICYRPTLL